MGRGDGTVLRHGKGWRIQYRWDGQTIRETASAVGRELGIEVRTKTDARRVLRKRLSALQDGTAPRVDARKKTLSHALALVKAEYEGKGRKAKATITRHIENLERIIGGHLRLREIDLEKIGQYVKARREEKTERKEPVSIATVNRELSCLSLALTKAQEKRWIGAKPRVAKLSGEQRRDLYVSPPEVERVIDELPSWLSSYIRFLYATSWRAGEARALRWGSCKARTVEGRAANTKTKLSKVVPISPAIREILDRAWSRRLGEDGDKDGLVFHQPSGARIGDHRRAWKTAKEKAGVDPDFEIRDLRGIWITDARRAGVPAVIVREVAGHSDGSVHEGYHRVVDDDLVSAFKRVEEYRSGYREKGGLVPWTMLAGQDVSGISAPSSPPVPRCEARS